MLTRTQHDSNFGDTLKYHKRFCLKLWRIVGENLEEIPINTTGIINFYETESYIIEWAFNTEQNSTENILYFHWTGAKAFKGYSPLPENADDNAPVERITQWTEPLQFVQLFSGKLVINIGEQNNECVEHLYILRGDECATYLIEVPRKKANLRSRTSFVLYDSVKKSSIIWHGGKSSIKSRNGAKRTAERVFGNNLVEIEEGEESELFLNSLDGDIQDYHRIYNQDMKKITVESSQKLFYFNNITGEFLSTEILPVFDVFPFLQAHLYTAPQPALFLLDDGEELWLWHGWLDNENFQSELMMAKVTSINYAKARNVSKVKMIYAGLEPLEFKNLFPIWEMRNDVQEIQILERKLKEGCIEDINY